LLAKPSVIYVPLIIIGGGWLECEEYEEDYKERTKLSNIGQACFNNYY